MPRIRFVLLALLPLLATAAGAIASPAFEDPVKTDALRSGPAPGTRAPGAPNAQPGAALPPHGAPAPRRPRSYEQCRTVAFQRHLRGAERRHYIARCQLGYGRPLFRRRGSRPVGAAPMPAPAGAPAGQL